MTITLENAGAYIGIIRFIPTHVGKSNRSSGLFLSPSLKKDYLSILMNFIEKGPFLTGSSTHQLLTARRKLSF